MATLTGSAVPTGASSPSQIVTAAKAVDGALRVEQRGPALQAGWFTWQAPAGEIYELTIRNTPLASGVTPAALIKPLTSSGVCRVTIEGCYDAVTKAPYPRFFATILGNVQA